MPGATLHSKRASIAIIAICQVAAMALWFSASAVVPALTAEFHLSKFTQSALTGGVQVGFVLGGPAAQLDPALAPAQVGVQVGQRGGPALRRELPGAVHHVTFQDGAQRAPFRLEQRPPGGGQHVGDVPGHLVAGQDALDAGIDPRLAAERHRDLALRLVRGCRPDLVEQVADGGVHARRDGSQEVGAPAGRVQRVDHAEVRLAGQRPVPVAGAEQPRAEHRPVPLARLTGQQAQRLFQAQRRRRPALGQR